MEKPTRCVCCALPLSQSNFFSLLKIRPRAFEPLSEGPNMSAVGGKGKGCRQITIKSAKVVVTNPLSDVF